MLFVSLVFFFFFKQKTAYEMRISDWSSDVCSSDLGVDDVVLYAPGGAPDRIYRGLIDRTMAALPLAVDGNHEVLVGDYDADGRDDIFWYGKGSRDDSRAFSDGNGRFTYVDTVISGWFAPAVGDFDGHGHDDVFWNGSEEPTSEPQTQMQNPEA